VEGGQGMAFPAGAPSSPKMVWGQRWVSRVIPENLGEPLHSRLEI
jgi:hypothetical protein